MTRRNRKPSAPNVDIIGNCKVCGYHRSAEAHKRQRSKCSAEMKRLFAAGEL